MSENQLLVGVPCASGRYECGRKELVVSLCLSIPIRCENRPLLCLPLFSPCCCSPWEGETKTAEKCPPSEVIRKDWENAHLRKVEEDGEVGQGRSVERVSRGG